MDPQILLVLILSVVALIVFMSTQEEGTQAIDIFVKEGIGPFVYIGPPTRGTKTEALVDTGSLYLLTTGSSTDSRNSLNPCSSIFLPSEEQEYHYAGPSAKFRWKNSNVVLYDKKPKVSGNYEVIYDKNSIKSIDLGCIPTGAVPPSSKQALGVEAVLGLCALPAWASQRFGVESLINYLDYKEFWFLLNGPNKQQLVLGDGEKFLDHRSTKIIEISTAPYLFSPTPGLGYLTQDIEELVVMFTQTHGYLIRRIEANPNLAQTNQFGYEENFSRKRGILKATEWLCLFDTGTFPAVFHAKGDVNLLGTRVAQSIIPGQMDDSDYITAHSVTYTFRDKTRRTISLQANNVLVPRIVPSDFEDVPALMTVCGFSFHTKYNMRYKIDAEIGLPYSVSFYT